MFKKLKDKIAEEVKSSPQRVQQLAQGVQAAVQSATGPLMQEDSISTDNADRDGSFTNVSLQNSTSPSHKRRNSNSSLASDVSFLPAFESHANIYHLQSDLDASASEIEDSYSGHLERVSKEQLLQGFRRMQMKYNKYRGRYTDLANHYRALERENARIKSVLVETQDKALRRVSELKEQCSLEQSAKAHMENVLREDLNEKQYLIDTLNTKIQLLQTPSVTDRLINLEPDSQMLGDLENYNTELQKELQDLKLLEQQHLKKISTLEEDFKIKIDEHSNIVAELNDAMHKKEVEINAVKSEKEKQNEFIQKLEEKCETQYKIIIEMKENEEKKDTLLSNFKEDVNKQQKEIENNLKKIQEGSLIISKLEQIIADKDTKIKLLNETTQQLKQEISDSKTIPENDNSRQISSLQESVCGKENEIIKLKQDVENCHKEINEKILQKDNVITNLNQDISNLTTELENYKQQNETLSNEILQLNEEHRLYINEIKNLKDTNKNHLEEIISLKNKCEENKEDITKLKESITNKDTELLKFKKALKEFKTKENSLDKKLKVQEEEFVKLKSNIIKCETEIQEQNQEILKQTDTINSLETNISNTEVIKTQLETQIEEYIAALNNKNKEIDEIKKIYEENTKDKDKYLQKIEVLKKTETEQNSELLEKLRLAEKNVAKLKKDNDKILKNLEKQKSDYEKREVSYEEKLSISETQINNVQKQLDEFITEKSNLKIDEKEMITLKGKLKENITLVNELNLMIVDKDVEIENINQKLSNKIKTVGELESILNENNKNLSLLKEKLSQKSILIDEIKKKKDTVEFDLQNTKLALNSENESAQSVKNELIKLQESLQKINLEKEKLIKTLETVTNEVLIKENQYQKNIEEVNAKLEKNNELLLDMQKKYNDVLQDKNNLTKLFEKDLADSKLQIQCLENEQVVNKEKYEANERKMVDTITKLEICLQQASQDKEETDQKLYLENTRLTKELKQVLENYEKITVEHKILYDEGQILKSTLEEDQKMLSELKKINDSFNAEKEENKTLMAEISILKNSLQEMENKFEDVSEAKNNISEEVSKLKDNLDNSSAIINDLRANITRQDEICSNLSKENVHLQNLLKASSTKSEDNYDNKNEIVSLQLIWDEEKKKFAEEITKLQQKLDVTNNNNLEMEKLLQEANKKIDENITKSDAQNLHVIMNGHKTVNNNIEITEYQNAIKELEDKISLYENMEITAKESVQYLQNELDKMKNKNEKLKSKLDETLVTLNHCADLSSSTEMEYLKNVLYNYMIGKESIVLARVIAAVCKFDTNQTETVLQKEHQKQTLLGQFGIL